MLFASFSLYAEVNSIFSLKGKKDQVLKEYKKQHKKFSTQLCRPGTEQKFWKLFKAYRGNGFYIPINHKEELDKVTLNRYLPELEKKIQWIKRQISLVSKQKTFSQSLKKLKDLEAIVERLLEYKQQYFETKNEEIQRTSKNRSRYLYIEFRSKFREFLEEIPFLVSYRFPVNHFGLRESYDEVKGAKTKREKQRANEVYFYRKIVQDGAQNSDHTRSDTFLRANLDTLVIKVDERNTFIPETIRFDLNSAFAGIKRHLEKGPKKQGERLKEWLKRTERTRQFYISLRDNRVKGADDSYLSGEELIEAKSKARYALKTFVLEKQKEAYDYWRSSPEVMQAIFSIETILFNEVGSFDGKEALERKDVTQVVINRFFSEKYNQILPENEIYSLLKGKLNKGEPLKKNPWLNVLFKEGEFSFTYFFIHGNVRIYCPDQSRRGRYLREKNIKIALDYLNLPDFDFKGIRYFSRAAMLGRIDMAPIWPNYREILERPGKRLKTISKYKKLYNKGNYQYRYHFRSPSGDMYKVIELNGRPYVLRMDGQDFFTYRNPHFFRYFSPRG
jgi:hypothetical protein